MTAREFAKLAHESIGQTRKFSGDPYYFHPRRVADRARFFKLGKAVEDAAELHDVVEDVAPTKPEFSLSRIVELFGSEVGDLVVEVTNVYTHEAFPDINRAGRNDLEHLRLSKISDKGKAIKLLDRWDNLGEMPDHGFGIKYAKESLDLIEAVRITSGPLKRVSDVVIPEIEDIIRLTLNRK